MDLKIKITRVEKIKTISKENFYRASLKEFTATGFFHLLCTHVCRDYAKRRQTVKLCQAENGAALLYIKRNYNKYCFHFLLLK